MAELPDLDPIPGANVSDDDLILIYDMENNRAYKVTRGNLLGNVARTGDDADFNVLSAETATFTEVTPALLSFASGGGIADMITASGESVSVPTIASQSSDTVTVTITGAVAGMVALVTFSDALAAGLVYHAHVSADDILTITFTNATAGSITGESKTAEIILFTLPV